MAKIYTRRSQWPRGLRRRSAAARLLRSWVRIPPGAWMFVCCECFVLSGRGLCDELITRPEESYRLWCVVVCDLETSRMRRPWPALGRSATAKKKTLMSKEFKSTITRKCTALLHNNTLALITIFINSFSSLSYDRSKASSKANSPHYYFMWTFYTGLQWICRLSTISWQIHIPRALMYSNSTLWTRRVWTIRFSEPKEISLGLYSRLGAVCWGMEEAISNS